MSTRATTHTSLSPSLPVARPQHLPADVLRCTLAAGLSALLAGVLAAFVFMALMLAAGCIVAVVWFVHAQMTGFRSTPHDGWWQAIDGLPHVAWLSALVFQGWSAGRLQVRLIGRRPNLRLTAAGTLAGAVLLGWVAIGRPLVLLLQEWGPTEGWYELYFLPPTFLGMFLALRRWPLTSVSDQAAEGEHAPLHGREEGAS